MKSLISIPKLTIKPVVFIGLSLIFVFILFGSLLFNWSKSTEAAGSLPPSGSKHNVYGWAWSENIGWISFNCYNDYNGDGDYLEDHCATVDYGVDIDNKYYSPTYGYLAGYAWSENIGWISFNASDLAGCPNGPCEAKINPITLKLSGWARALAPKGKPLEQTGGWEGWIKLRDTSYGVSLNASVTPVEFYGWAWGGDDSTSTAVLGWISFNDKDYDGGPGPVDYQVVTAAAFSNAPTAENLTSPLVTTKEYCKYYKIDSTITPGGAGMFVDGIVNFSWLYKDDDGDPQYRYHLWVDDGAGNPEVDKWVCGDNTPAYSTSYSSVAVKSFLTYELNNWCEGTPYATSSVSADALTFNKTYNWRVEVCDDKGNCSEENSGSAFSTPNHRFPNPNFSSIPQYPTKGQVAQFCSVYEDEVCEENPPLGNSTCYDSFNNPISCWSSSFLLWTIPTDASFATGSNATTRNPKIKFTSTGAVILEITDSDGFGPCVFSDQIKIGAALPEWKEIPPF